MALITGPLYSQEARGQFGKTVVFRRRKGQNVASSYVVPANPNTDKQKTNRNYMAVIGVMVRETKLKTIKLVGTTETSISFLTSISVGANTWANTLGSHIMGSGNANIAADVAAYEALANAQKAKWEAFAANALVGFNDIERGDGVSFAKGLVAFLFQKGLRELGYGSAWANDNVDPDNPVAP